jgi:putative NADH-flavin reductase
MELAILGGSGATGGLLIEQALSAGHDVTALVRRAESLDPVRGRVRIVTGELNDPAAVAETLRSAQAVISALGSRQGRKNTTVYSDGIGAVLAGGAQRIVAVSAVPAAPDEFKTYFERHLVHPLLHLFFGGSYDDMRRMEGLLSASDTEWTVLRPPRLTNGVAKGTFRESTTQLRRPSSISRADLAAALLQSVEQDALVRKFVTVSY